MRAFIFLGEACLSIENTQAAFDPAAHTRLGMPASGFCQKANGASRIVFLVLLIAVYASSIWFSIANG
jgi:hypothetical protein